MFISASEEENFRYSCLLPSKSTPYPNLQSRKIYSTNRHPLISHMLGSRIDSLRENIRSSASDLQPFTNNPQDHNRLRILKVEDRVPKLRTSWREANHVPSPFRVRVPKENAVFPGGLSLNMRSWVFRKLCRRSSLLLSARSHFELVSMGRLWDPSPAGRCGDRRLHCEQSALSKEISFFHAYLCCIYGFCDEMWWTIQCHVRYSTPQ
jgi:hypothetical protein